MRCAPRSGCATRATTAPPPRISTMTTQTQTAPDSAAARERLRELIVELAVVRGRVTLASGMEAAMRAWVP